ncbi:Ogr/Delta-like zinc finger [compost metagenome]
MRIKDSDEKSATAKTMYAQCTNFGCSASFVGTLSWDFELAPSAMEQPRLSLPPAPSVRRTRILVAERSRDKQQMDMLDAAPC